MIPVPTLSLLIPTVEGREKMLDYLLFTLHQQLDSHAGLRQKVEIVVLKDKKGERSIGQKRNELYASAKGLWSQSIDDDDAIHHDYLWDAVQKLELENPDTLRLDGVIRIDGGPPKRFIHSIEIRGWNESDGIYYRPPNHLNPIRSSIAKEFLFPEKNFGEDRDWCLQICNSRVLKTEARLDYPYYFYDFFTHKDY